MAGGLRALEKIGASSCYTTRRRQQRGKDKVLAKFVIETVVVLEHVVVAAGSGRLFTVRSGSR